MIQNLRNGDFYSNRKEAKMRLGGRGAFNASMRRGELLFISDGNSVYNHLNQKLSYGKEGKKV